MRGVLSIDRRWQVVVFVSPDRSSAARAAHREQARSYKEMASLTDWAIAGKIAMGDIRTGEQTILDYLIKPLNRARDAQVSSHV